MVVVNWGRWARRSLVGCFMVSAPARANRITEDVRKAFPLIEREINHYMATYEVRDSLKLWSSFNLHL